ncbi:hypothetical protein BAE44_0022441 [Dichanthelium oligosanthes]|uniref:Late embryogenesis abundant protein LEA-2 subgroup domain-containing protein n=1 Tax=Dichanthelium oligosanthes TaxID=888268 RepID=A0A1E5UUJ4_9POAL|nr:hypothetical protein BAE44_0022441 [Dichanthelium oligosanthes]
MAISQSGQSVATVLTNSGLGVPKSTPRVGERREDLKQRRRRWRRTAAVGDGVRQGLVRLLPGPVPVHVAVRAVLDAAHRHHRRPLAHLPPRPLPAPRRLRRACRPQPRRALQRQCYIRKLRYDLAVDLSFRNSHGRLTIRYLDVGAAAFYNGTKLRPADDVLQAPFHQGPKNTTVRAAPGVPWRRGRGLRRGGGAGAGARGGDGAREAVRISVALTLMYKVWLAKEVFFYKYDCWIWFPPPANATPAVFDAGAQCWAA